MCGAKVVEKSVERKGLSTRSGRAVGGTGVHERSVHVPLHEGDVVISQQRVQLFVDVRKRRLVGEIQHQLVTGLYCFITACVQHPFGMRSRNVTVGIHHLGLHPNAEVHTKGTHVFDQRGEPVGVHVP